MSASFSRAAAELTPASPRLPRPLIPDSPIQSAQYAMHHPEPSPVDRPIFQLTQLRHDMERRRARLAADMRGLDDTESQPQTSQQTAAQPLTPRVAVQTPRKTTSSFPKLTPTTPLNVSTKSDHLLTSGRNSRAFEVAFARGEASTVKTPTVVFAEQPATLTPRQSRPAPVETNLSDLIPLESASLSSEVSDLSLRQLIHRIESSLTQLRAQSHQNASQPSSSPASQQQQQQQQHMQRNRALISEKVWRTAWTEQMQQLQDRVGAQRVQLLQRTMDELRQAEVARAEQSSNRRLQAQLTKASQELEQERQRFAAKEIELTRAVHEMKASVRMLEEDLQLRAENETDAQEIQSEQRRYNEKLTIELESKIAALQKRIEEQQIEAEISVEQLNAEHNKRVDLESKLAEMESSLQRAVSAATESKHEAQKAAQAALATAAAATLSQPQISQHQMQQLMDLYQRQQKKDKSDGGDSSDSNSDSDSDKSKNGAEVDIMVAPIAPPKADRAKSIRRASVAVTPAAPAKKEAPLMRRASMMVTTSKQSLLKVPSRENSQPSTPKQVDSGRNSPIKSMNHPSNSGTNPLSSNSNSASSSSLTASLNRGKNGVANEMDQQLSTFAERRRIQAMASQHAQTQSAIQAISVDATAIECAKHIPPSLLKLAPSYTLADAELVLTLPRRVLLKCIGLMFQQKRDAMYPQLSADIGSVAIPAANNNITESAFSASFGSIITPPVSLAVSSATAATNAGPSNAALNHFVAPADSMGFPEFVHSFFVMRHGHLDGADVDFIDFLATVERFSTLSARVRVFRRFATENYPLRALSFYSGLVALLRRFGVGPMSEVGDNDEGACWVELESIIRVLRNYLKLSKSDLEVCEQKVRSLAADSTFGSGGSAVGGHFDKFIELDDVAEYCMELWLREDFHCSSQLEQLLSQSLLNAPQLDRFGKSHILANEQQDPITVSTFALTHAGSNMSAAASAEHLANQDAVATEAVSLRRTASTASPSMSPEPSHHLNIGKCHLDAFAATVAPLMPHWSASDIVRAYQLCFARASRDIRAPILMDFVPTLRSFGLMPVRMLADEKIAAALGDKEVQPVKANHSAITMEIPVSQFPSFLFHNSQKTSGNFDAAAPATVHSTIEALLQTKDAKITDLTGTQLGTLLKKIEERAIRTVQKDQRAMSDKLSELRDLMANMEVRWAKKMGVSVRAAFDLSPTMSPTPISPNPLSPGAQAANVLASVSSFESPRKTIGRHAAMAASKISAATLPLDNLSPLQNEMRSLDHNMRQIPATAEERQRLEHMYEEKVRLTKQALQDSMNAAATELYTARSEMEKITKASMRTTKQYQTQILKLEAQVEAERARARVLPIDEHALDELRAQLAHAQEIITHQKTLVKGSQLLLERARMSGEDAASARAVLEQQALTLKTENATLRRMNQNAKQKAQAAARAELAAAAKAAKLDDDDEYEGD